MLCLYSSASDFVRLCHLFKTCKNVRFRRYSTCKALLRLNGGIEPCTQCTNIKTQLNAIFSSFHTIISHIAQHTAQRTVHGRALFDFRCHLSNVHAMFCLFCLCRHLCNQFAIGHRIIDCMRLFVWPHQVIYFKWTIIAILSIDFSTNHFDMIYWW